VALSAWEKAEKALKLSESKYLELQSTVDRDIKVCVIYVVIGTVIDRAGVIITAC